MAETQDILLIVLHAVTCTEHRPQAHVHAESKPDKHTPRSWASMSHPCTMYTRMHTHNSHLHRPVTQALCTRPHMYTPCIHTQLHSLTHTARACTPTSPTSLILPSPTESPPTLQSPKPLTFPLAFLPCHTPLAALKGSPRGRLPKQVEEQSWRESRGMGGGEEGGTTLGWEWAPLSAGPAAPGLTGSRPLGWPLLSQPSLILHGLHKPQAWLLLSSQ